MSKSLNVGKADTYGGYDEDFFTVSDGAKYVNSMNVEVQDRVYIHPWNRGFKRFPDRQVFIRVGAQSKDGHEYDCHEEEEPRTIIVDRDKFIEGLLAVFPELTMKKYSPNLL